LSDITTAVPQAVITLYHFQNHITVRKQWKILYNLVINVCEFYTFDRHCLFNKKKYKIIHDLLYTREICNIVYLLFIFSFTDDLSICTSG